MIYDNIKWYKNKGYLANETYGQQHRYIWERYNNCKIPEGMVIHHKNGKRDDNDINNLELMTSSHHGKLHAKGRKFSKETRQKMSEAKKGKPGIKHSEETKEKLRQMNTGNKNPRYGVKEDPEHIKSRIDKVSETRRTKATSEMIEDIKASITQRAFKTKYGLSSCQWQRFRTEQGI